LLLKFGLLGAVIKAMPNLRFTSKQPNVSYLFLSMDKTADKWKAVLKTQLKDHFMANDQMKGVFAKL
jgi:hypothetical protein